MITVENLTFSYEKENTEKTFDEKNWFFEKNDENMLQLKKIRTKTDEKV